MLAAREVYYLRIFQNRRASRGTGLVASLLGRRQGCLGAPSLCAAVFYFLFFYSRGRILPALRGIYCLLLFAVADLLSACVLLPLCARSARASLRARSFAAAAGVARSAWACVCALLPLFHFEPGLAVCVLFVLAPSAIFRRSFGHAPLAWFSVKGCARACVWERDRKGVSESRSRLVVLGAVAIALFCLAFLAAITLGSFLRSQRGLPC